MNRKLVNRLAESLTECRDMLERIQNEQDGKGEMPWPEIDRATSVLADFAATQERGKTSLADLKRADQSPEPVRTRDTGRER